MRGKEPFDLPNQANVPVRVYSALVDLYRAACAAQNGGTIPYLEADEAKGWIVQRKVNGVDLIIMGPDPDMPEITPCVACRTADQKFLWMAVFGSSYTGIYSDPENLDHMARVSASL